MKYLLRTAIAASLLCGSSLAMAATDSPVGTWKSIDDVTGKPRSIVEITEQNGTLQGQVKQILNLSPEEVARDGQHPRCLKCEGDRKGKPIEGMVILWGVKKNGNAWDGGQIIDPKKGSIYKVKLTLEDGGQKLDVHGYIGISMLGRSQTWIRQQ